jgi:hypothetical protein
MITGDIIDDLRWLVEEAVSRGADHARALQAAETIIDLLLNLQDPRTRAALDLASRVRRAHASGMSISQLCERFGRSRSTIHRLLGVSRLHETFPRFNAVRRQTRSD